MVESPPILMNAEIKLESGKEKIKPGKSRIPAIFMSDGAGAAGAGMGVYPENMRQGTVLSVACFVFHNIIPHSRVAVGSRPYVQETSSDFPEY